MSGTSARESYRSGKRTRPSNSQPSPTTPPVLFRLPSVHLPSPDSAVSASNMSAATMAMPMTTAAAASTPVTASAPAVPTSPAATSSNAAVSAATEKSSGQRLLNMMIVVLLLAALAVIAWISLNRPTVGSSMATSQVGNNAALESLGDLKVPEVSTGTVADVAKPQPTSSDTGLIPDEIEPNPGDVSLIDLPKSPTPQSTDNQQPESLSLGLDLAGVDASATNTSASTTASATPTAQIQLRTPVPLGSSNVTSLVDAQGTVNQFGDSSTGTSSSPRVETVSTPTQPTKIFPANTDPAGLTPAVTTPNSSGSTASSSATKPATNSNNTNTNSGSSPTLWDGAQRSALEGLQLSNKAGTGPTQVNISNPLSAEISMSAPQGTNLTARSTVNNAVNDTVNSTAANQASPGVTVGGGAKEPYTLPSGSASTASSNLQRTRADLDPTVLARVAASGAAKSAVSGSTTAPSSKPINSYAVAGASSAGQNLYQNQASSPAATNSSMPINSYASVPGNVPPGTTGNGTQPYIPPSSASAAPPTQFASGSNSVPSMTAGYTVPPRATQGSFSSPTNPNNGGYSQPGSTPNFSNQPMQAYPQQPTTPQAGFQRPVAPQQPNQQPTFQQPTFQQPTYQSPNYQQPNYQPAAGYGQPTYSSNAYGQPNTAYGPASGAGYVNPAYPSPNMNTGMAAPGYQSGASYPTRNSFPGAQVPTGMIGPSGNATAPTGDIAPVQVLGRGGVGTSTPYGAPQ